jgi:hypothetical protein
MNVLPGAGRSLARMGLPRMSACFFPTHAMDTDEFMGNLERAKCLF